MKSYFCSFLRNNRIKVALLGLSLSLYFSLLAVAMTLEKSVPEIASIPLKSIGVQTIVQKSGKIPARMAGAVFPHSNAPIGDAELDKLKGLEFVEGFDRGLYFWFFDKSFFKAVLGVEEGSRVFAGILGKNVMQGSLDLTGSRIVITDDFARRNGIALGGRVEMAGKVYGVSGILRPNLSGNIIPADIYMGIDQARDIARRSEEMRKLYDLGERFGNVVLLKTNPAWEGDKEKAVKAIDRELIVFSEKTFSREITGQLKLISAAGRIMFAALGVVLAISFCLMVSFNLKTREKEIALLRMLGWRIADLKGHFIGESLMILLAALLVGNILTFLGLTLLGQQSLAMELPWDISAKPHFLPLENSIERIVRTTIPVHYDWMMMGMWSVVFIAVFLLINYLMFYRIKRIKPYGI